MSDNTEVCSCGAKAIWVYSPATSSSPDPYRCDDCVPRGQCSCTCCYSWDLLSIATENMGLPAPPFIPWLHTRRQADGRFVVCVDWDLLEENRNGCPV